MIEFIYRRVLARGERFCGRCVRVFFILEMAGVFAQRRFLPPAEFVIRRGDGSKEFEVPLVSVTEKNESTLFFTRAS